MKRDEVRLTFSQREGKAPLPEPIRGEHLSHTFRNDVWLCVDIAISKVNGPFGLQFVDLYPSSSISNFITYYIRTIDGIPHDEIPHVSEEHRSFLKQRIINDSYDSVITFIETLLRYPVDDPILSELREELKGLFEHAPVAYAVQTMQGLPTIIPRGSPESGAATTRALDTVEQEGPEGAKAHLRKAGENIRAF